MMVKYFCGGVSGSPCGLSGLACGYEGRRYEWRGALTDDARVGREACGRVGHLHEVLQATHGEIVVLGVQQLPQ
jgi:hypothetical protein